MEEGYDVKEKKGFLTKGKVIFIWLIIGIIVFLAWGIATTTISENLISTTGNGSFSNSLSVGNADNSYAVNVNGSGNFTGSLFIEGNINLSTWKNNVSLNWTNLAINILSSNFTAINNSIIQLYTINNTANIWGLISGILANVAWQNQTNVFLVDQNFSQKININSGKINLNNNASLGRQETTTNITISSTGNVIVHFGT